MKHVVEAGTDAANLVLFDPGALPAGFDRLQQVDPFGTLEALTEQGRACLISTEGDGFFRLHAYVDEPVPQRLGRYAIDPSVIPDFSVPSGQLFFTGSEYTFRDDGSFLRKYPHMGSSFLVRPGSYRLTLSRLDYPRGSIDAELRQQSSPWEYRLWASQSVVITLAIAAWIGLVIVFFNRHRMPWVKLLFTSLGLLAASPFLLFRMSAFRRAKERVAWIERDHPFVVAQLSYEPP
jgi:hypothetical protein